MAIFQSKKCFFHFYVYSCETHLRIRKRSCVLISNFSAFVVVVVEVVIGFRPDHHLGRMQGVVSSPKLPNDSSVVIVFNWIRVVFAVEVGLETTKEDK